MRERNDGKGADNILQNRFTAYLVKAVRNRKIQYLRAKQRHDLYELPFDISDFDAITHDESDLLGNLSLIEQLEDFRLQQVLRQAKTRDLYIFLAKALDDRSLSDIAKELGIGLHAATSAYYRMVRKLRRELGGGGK
jgi:DNA-directed RNA polymerase specialized sigma24 family protein